MAKSTKILNDEIKTRYLEGISEHLSVCGEEVLRVGSNELAIPVLDEDNNEKWLVLTFKVPTGSRNDDGTREEYDGYGEAESYELKLKEKAEKKAKAEKEKARKIAKQQKVKEQKGE